MRPEGVTRGIGFSGARGVMLRRLGWRAALAPMVAALLALLAAPGCSSARPTASSGSTNTTPGTGLLAGQVVYQGQAPGIAAVTYTDKNGTTVTQPVALQGWVTLFVSPSADLQSVAASIASNGGNVVDSIPRVGLYVIQVGTGQEAAFLSTMFAQSFVVDGEPTTLDVGAAMAAIDFFLEVIGCGGTHGDNVTAIMQRGGQRVTRLPADGDPYLLGNTGLVAQLQSLLNVVEGTLRPSEVRQLITQANAGSAAGQPTVINLSLQSGLSAYCNAHPGDPDCVDVPQAQFRFFLPILTAINELNPSVRNNTVVVIAAGNAGADLTLALMLLQNDFPDAWQHVLIVGGGDASGELTMAWNYASSGIVCAPSLNVPTTTATHTCSGTSFAAPEVSRVIDAIWRANPTLTSAEVVALFRAALSSCGHGASPLCLPTDPMTQQTTAAFLACTTALAMGAGVDAGDSAAPCATATVSCGGMPCCTIDSFCNAVGQCLPNPPGGCTTLCGTTCCGPGQTCDLGSCTGAVTPNDAGSDSATDGGSCTLTVNLVGAGSGESVASQDGTITCGPGPVVAPCTATYACGTQVTLTATAGDAEFTFGGWSGGGCSGTTDCTTTLAADETVTATFHANLIFTSNGSVTAPTGISSVNAQVWGGGGQGAFVGSFNSQLACYTGTGGGGGGAYVAGSVAIVAGSMYPIVVGCGGCLTSPDPKQYNLGGTSSIASLSAGGGQGGYDSPPNGGAGGTCAAAGCVPGTMGAAGSTSSCKGGNGGAAGGAGGGAGGVYGTNGGNGTAPGGGGAGSEGIAGGQGAPGQVVVSW